MIKFRYQEEIPEDQTFSGIINLIRFRAMTTGSTTVTVEIDEGGSEI